MNKYLLISIIFLLAFLNFKSYAQEIYNIGGKNVTFEVPKGFNDGLKKYETIKYYAKTYSSEDNQIYAVFVRDSILEILHPDTLTYVDINEYFKLYSPKAIQNIDASDFLFKAIVSNMHKSLNYILEEKSTQERLAILAKEVEETTGKGKLQINSLSYFNKENPDDKTSIIYGLAKSEFTEGGVTTYVTGLQSITIKNVNKRIVMCLYFRRIENFKKEYGDFKIMTNSIAKGLK